MKKTDIKDFYILKLLSYVSIEYLMSKGKPYILFKTSSTSFSGKLLNIFVKNSFPKELTKFMLLVEEDIYERINIELLNYLIRDRLS